MAIAGINVFTDYQTKSSHKRLSLGLEYQRANFSANINKYHVFSDKKLVNPWCCCFLDRTQSSLKA
jgi:hypothetical protein